jgi:hypothetical protein
VVKLRASIAETAAAAPREFGGLVKSAVGRIDAGIAYRSSRIVLRRMSSLPRPRISL